MTRPRAFHFARMLSTRHRNDLFTLNQFSSDLFHVEQIPCWITHTTPRTHDIIRANLDKSPMYTGRIRGGRTSLLPFHRG